MKEKKCKNCGIIKPLTDFSPHKSYTDGHINVCKKCINKRQVEKRAEIYFKFKLPDPPETEKGFKICSECGEKVPNSRIVPNKKYCYTCKNKMMKPDYFSPNFKKYIQGIVNEIVEDKKIKKDLMEKEELDKKIKIYKIIDNETNKVVYVGKTSQKIKKRFSQHRNDKIRFKKYKYLQEHDCRIELITQCDTSLLAKQAENRYIMMYDTVNNGLNGQYETKNSKYKKISETINAEAKAKAIIKALKNNK